MPKIRGLAEVVIWVHDMDAALAFYRDVLGLKPLFPPDGRGAVFLRAGEAAVSCPQQVVLVPLPAGTEAFPTERSKRSLHHLGLEIAPEDFEDERQHLQSLGFDVRLGEHPFLPLKGMYIDDPDGNEVEIISSRT